MVICISASWQENITHQFQRRIEPLFQFPNAMYDSKISKNRPLILHELQFIVKITTNQYVRTS